MTDARSEILTRIRTALDTPATPHGRSFADGRERIDPRTLLPSVPDDVSTWPQLFAERLEALSGTCHRVGDETEAASVLARLALRDNWRNLAVHADDLVMRLARGLGLPMTTAGSDRYALARCDASITSCRALVVQTGSVLVTAADGGRIGSVLPEHHVVVTSADRLVPDLPAAWASIAGNAPSFASLITGPSRTADIERTLVLGAHGPIHLSVIILDAKGL